MTAYAGTVVKLHREGCLEWPAESLTVWVTAERFSAFAVKLAPEGGSPGTALSLRHTRGTVLTGEPPPPVLSTLCAPAEMLYNR